MKNRAALQSPMGFPAARFFIFSIIFFINHFLGALGPQIDWGGPGPRIRKKKIRAVVPIFIREKINWGALGPPIDLGGPGPHPIILIKNTVFLEQIAKQTVKPIVFYANCKQHSKTNGLLF